MNGADRKKESLGTESYHKGILGTKLVDNGTSKETNDSKAGVECSVGSISQGNIFAHSASSSKTIQGIEHSW